MPNWCDNFLTWKGFGSLKSREQIKNDWEDFSRIIPLPFAMKQGTKKSSPSLLSGTKTRSQSWYAFCVKHWGTKWSANVISVKGKSLEAETAWCPPSKEWLKKFYERYTTLKFELYFVEPGAEIEGRVFMHNGKLRFSRSKRK